MHPQVWTVGFEWGAVPQDAGRYVPASGLQRLSLTAIPSGLFAFAADTGASNAALTSSLPILS